VRNRWRLPPKIVPLGPGGSPARIDAVAVLRLDFIEESEFRLYLQARSRRKSRFYQADVYRLVDVMRKTDALQILKAKLVEIEQEHHAECADDEMARQPLDAKAEARALAQFSIF
jgi:hypothetical protein